MSENRPAYRVDVLAIPDIAESIESTARMWGFTKDHMLNLVDVEIISGGGDMWDPLSIRAALRNLHVTALTMRLPSQLGARQVELPIDSTSRADRKSVQKFKPSQIRNKTQVVNYSRLILAALEEVLEYSPAKHHNFPPPDLRLENPEYLSELREIAALLRQLISLLSEARPSPSKTHESIGRLASYSDLFLKTYIPVVAKGSGYLTVAAFGGLLYQAGLASEVVDELLKLVRFAR